jgi:hypothetical protein
VEKVRAIPGVTGAASINLIPFTNFANATFYLLEGQPRSKVAGQVALIRNVTRDYFETVGAQLREGRFFTADDRKSPAPVAIVNEQFAKRAYPGQSPIGKRFKFGSLGNKGYWYTIVGVVKQIPESGMLDEVKPAVTGSTSSPSRSATWPAASSCAPPWTLSRSFRQSGRRSGRSTRPSRSRASARWTNSSIGS